MSVSETDRHKQQGQYHRTTGSESRTDSGKRRGALARACARECGSRLTYSHLFSFTKSDALRNACWSQSQRGGGGHGGPGGCAVATTRVAASRTRRSYMPERAKGGKRVKDGTSRDDKCECIYKMPTPDWAATARWG